MSPLLVQRFWERISKSGTEHLPGLGKCWEWTAGVSAGYGHIQLKKKQYLAHRLSWQINRGGIPSGMCVLHKCDNRKCVRPSHLFLGTKEDNYRDAVAKDRHTRGERQGRAKLTDKLVRIIRHDHRLGSREFGAGALAKRFDVSRSTVRAVLGRTTRTSWKHV